MKTLFYLLGVALSIIFTPLLTSAAEVPYTDATGCTHTPVLLKSGEAAYWNLDADSCNGDLFTSKSGRYPGDDLRPEEDRPDPAS
ncbi:MAG: hypothetical protein WAU17_02495 [Nitrospirales bacterium]